MVLLTTVLKPVSETLQMEQVVMNVVAMKGILLI